MTVLLLILPILSLLVLGAHFFRAGQLPFVALCVITLALLTVRRVWAARTVQIVLLLGTVEWLLTTFRLRAARQALGEPSGRMVLILGAVALVTLLSAFLFETGRLKRRYAGNR